MKNNIVIGVSLASEILNVRVVDIKLQEQNILTVITEKDSFAINLYEFIHKNCKEWINSKGYFVSMTLIGNVEMCCISKDNTKIEKTFFDDYENDCYIKACVWVMEQLVLNEA